MGLSKVRIILLVVAISIFCVGIGILIGYFIGAYAKPSSPQPIPDYLRDEDTTISAKLFAEVNPQNIRNNLLEWTKKAHLAGTAEDLNGAQKMYNIWKDQYKMDSVTLTRYNVLLCYPNKQSPSKVELKDNTGKVIFTSRGMEDATLTPNQNNDPEAVLPFHAYAKSGDLQGDVVYANYCRLDDLDSIEKYLKNRSDTLVGKIVICRYGRIGRMDKVNNIQQRNGRGVIIYSDPKDYVSNDGTGVFPNSWWLPPTGVQRGTVIMSSGDPLTPTYPSIDSAYRIPIANSTDLPLIPSLPLSYSDAAQLMASMQGDEVPADWRGNMNISYRYGPGHTNGVKVRLYVNNSFEIRSTHNVIGFIRGRVEPDRYVMVGNHRDAWVYGAVDPTSGTASLIELTRTFSELVRTGWRPRRSLVFCSWGAEEYTLIGSYEWVEENFANIAARAVAYINMDVAMEGNFSLEALGMPLLYEAVYAATKKVPDPHGGTVYDHWLKSFPNDDKTLPQIFALGGASDYGAFVTKVGVPCVDFAYTFNRNVKLPLSAPLYHTIYDTFYAVDNFFDPGFFYHQTTVRVVGELMRSLADSLIIPFNFASYGDIIASDFDAMIKGHGQKWTDHQVNITGMQNAISLFKQAVSAFTARLKDVDKKDPFAVRRINDQIMMFERAFIDPRGLPGRPEERHMLFAPSIHDSYAGNYYPGLIDGMWNIENDPDQFGRYETIKKHMSVLAFTIQSAASVLAETYIPQR